MTYTNALRHTVTGKWCVLMLNEQYTWTDNLWLADVFDADDKAAFAKPYNSEWVALTWEQYCDLMDGRPDDMNEWFAAINAARDMN